VQRCACSLPPQRGSVTREFHVWRQWESPRGPISIDPNTRDIVQNVYIRKVEKKDGEPWAVEFATFEAVKDPLKEAAAK